MKKKYLIGSILLFAVLLLSSFPSLALILGDFNGDGQVQFEDLMIFALAYGSTPEDGNWNPVCDIASAGGVLTSGGVINFEDLMIFALHYGEVKQITWTVMVYMDGDNSLDSCAWDDLSELESVSSTDEIKIVTQLDAYNSCDGTFRYYINGAAQGASYPLYPDDIVQTLPEQNMADPSTLTSFVNWAISNYPAEKYLLVLWNHGGGWRDRNILTKGIIWDDTTGDFMTIAELVQGLEGVNENIDVIGFDACLMQMAEVAYEIYGLTNTPGYMIGSQESEWGDGWPYDDILSHILANPRMTNTVLCETIVDDFINYCGTVGTLSALDFSAGQDSYQALNSFATALMASSHQGEIAMARASAQSYSYSDGYRIKDIYDFAERIKNNVPDCQSQAQTVMNQINNLILYEANIGSAVASSHGLSIYLPDNAGEYDNDYNSLQFAIDTQWDEFLQGGQNRVTEVSALAFTYHSSMSKIQSKIDKLIEENKLHRSYLLVEPKRTTKGDVVYEVDIEWAEYTGADGYKIYRSVNGGSYTSIAEGTVDPGYDYYYFVDTNVTAGSTYSYYVTAYATGWETCASDPATTTPLPSCLLISPTDGTTINNNPNPSFSWSPVGVSDYPYGAVSSGESDLYVEDKTDDSVSWWTYFTNMTTSTGTYNQDGQATALVYGHSYTWDSWGYGYNEDGKRIAISESGDWGFDYEEIPETNIHNITQNKYYNTIQAALDDADTNNTIEVSDGTYDESISFPSGKKISLQSINGNSSTIIQGNNGSDTVYLNSSLEGTTLEGFTITHASTNEGRGIYIDGGYLNINDCIISDNNSNNNGGGLLNNANTIIIGSTISNNTASTDDVHTGCFGGGVCNSGILTINGSTVSDNISELCGGGIYNSENSTLTIFDSNILQNYASELCGGGIRNSANGNLTITKSIISDNSVHGFAAGIYTGIDTGIISIGGESEDEKNIICGNYCSDDNPSLDQQIRSGSESLYDIFKDTNHISAYCNGADPVVRRALLVGVGDYLYGDNDLNAPPYDVDMMHDTLNHSGDGFSLINELKDLQATKSAILNGIASTFSEADSNDVSYFYFTGRGGALDNISYLMPTDYDEYTNTCISVSELEFALSAIPGIKVVFLNSCHSGGFIGKEINQGDIAGYLKSFNDDVINIFMTRDLTNSQYQVLTSCLSSQTCVGLTPSEGNPFGLFSAVLCEGCGYNYYIHPYYADVNENAEITLDEAYDYTYEQVNSTATYLNDLYGWDIEQDTQVYPLNSDFIIIEY